MELAGTGDNNAGVQGRPGHDRYLFHMLYSLWCESLVKKFEFLKEFLKIWSFEIAKNMPYPRTSG